MPRFQGGAGAPEPGPIGVLLANLGTPDAPTAGALRRYLAEFLHDRRVVELPPVLWWPILHGIVLRVRPRRSAAKYASIWTDAGSPLLVLTDRLAQGVASALGRTRAGGFRVAIGMRYGRPSIADALRRLERAGAQRVLVLPLYPQYAGATTGSSFDAVAAELRRWRRVPELRWVGDYHDDPGYLDAVADSIREAWAAEPAGERLLISFHGLPERSVTLGDPYRRHCERTAEGVAERLGLAGERWALSFQSRFGPARWLQPYTRERLQGWAAEGVKTVDVICPGFAVDCLETLEEIAIENAEEFAACGGSRLRYLPALNDGAAHVAALAGIIRRHAAGWEAP